MPITYLSVLLLTLSAAPTEASYRKMPMAKVEELERMNQVLNDIDDVKSLLNKRSREFEIHCLKATGDLPICECLSSQTPIELSYKGYSHLVSASTEELDFKRRTKDEKNIIKGAFEAREKCVK